MIVGVAMREVIRLSCAILPTKTNIKNELTEITSQRIRN